MLRKQTSVVHSLKHHFDDFVGLPGLVTALARRGLFPGGVSVPELPSPPTSGSVPRIRKKIASIIDVKANILNKQPMPTDNMEVP